MHGRQMLGVWEVSEKHGTETGEVMGDSDMGRMDMAETKWQVMAWQRDMGRHEEYTRKRVLVVGFGHI